MNADAGVEFAHVCRRFRPNVTRFVVSLIRPTELDDIEDLVQVVFLRAWRAWPTFAGTAEEQVRAFLFTIARRAVADHYRYGAANQRCERPTNPAAQVFADEQSADHADRVCELIDLAVSMTAKGQRARAVQLRVVEQLAWREIGARLKCGEPVARRLVAVATDGYIGEPVTR